MLSLTRKAGEQLVIGGNIIVKVVSVTRQRVRLAIDAPQDVLVDRQEVFERRKNNSKGGLPPSKD